MNDALKTFSIALGWRNNSILTHTLQYLLEISQSSKVNIKHLYYYIYIHMYISYQYGIHTYKELSEKRIPPINFL